MRAWRADSMDAETARRTARIAGLGALPLGVALMGWRGVPVASAPRPQRGAAVSQRLGPRPGRGLAAETGRNVAVGGYFFRVARQEDSLAAKAAVAAMAVATAADVRAINASRRDH